MRFWSIRRRPATRLLCLEGGFTLLALALKVEQLLPSHPVPPLAWVWNEAATTYYSSGITSTFNRHLMPRDEIHALATCRCNQESLKQVVGVRISFSYEAAPKADDGDLTRMTTKAHCRTAFFCINFYVCALIIYCFLVKKNLSALFGEFFFPTLALLETRLQG